MTKSRIILLLVTIIGLYAGIALWEHRNKAPPYTPSALNVTVVQPESVTMWDEIGVIGTTIARSEAVAMTELSAIRVQHLFVDVGEHVVKGQTLLVLDGESLLHQLAQAQSDYDVARQYYADVDAIRNTGAVSQETIAERLGTMQSAKAKWENALLNVRRSTVLSPVEGVVFERSATVGALVSASTPLYRIAQDGEVELNALIPEEDVARVAVGQQAIVTLTGYTESLQGDIRRITPNIDTTNRTAAVRMTLSPKMALPVGLFGRATIRLKVLSGSSLPDTAIQQDESGLYVWSLDGESRSMRLPVSVLLRRDGKVLVASLPPDLRIIARAGAFVRERETVHVVEGS